MKKLFSFVVAIIFATATFAATQYCQEPLVATNGTALLSLKHQSGNTYEVELVAQGGMLFTAAYNINCGVNQTVGAGIGFGNANWVISEDKTTATFEFTTSSAESVPTGLYGNYMAFQKTGGTGGDLVEFKLDAITDIDWTATCGGQVEDNVNPVMGKASLASVTYNTAVINVAGTDKTTEGGEETAVSKFRVVYGETTKVFTATDGQITIKDLTPGTTYNFAIYAVDAVGNVSDNSAAVSATTDALSYCDFATGHLGDANFGDAEGRILLTLSNPSGNVVRVTVKPNKANGATKNLDYLRVYAPDSEKEGCVYEAGAQSDDAAAAKESLSVDITYASMPESISQLEIKWSQPAWDGEWSLTINNIAPASFCDDTTTLLPVLENAAPVRKVIREGQLYIIRDGVRYNALGQLIE